MTYAIRHAGRFLTILLCVTPALAADAEQIAQPFDFAPEPATQATLAEFAAAPDATARSSALTAIRALDASDRPALIRNLAAFAHDATSTRDAMVAGAVIRALDIPDNDVVRALVPLLDVADAELAAQAANMLGAFEGKSATRAPDFSRYREIIAEAERTGEPAPRGLIAHMFATSPGTALLAMTRATRLGESDHPKLRRLVWAEHVIADVIWKHDNGFLEPDRSTPEANEQFTLLARDDVWWVRLYAAEVARQHAALGTPEERSRLRSDADPAVRSVAESAASAASPH